MTVLNLMNKAATRAKGRPFELDSRVTSTYLARTAARRVVMKVRGSCRLRASKPFIGKRVTLMEKRLMVLGRNVVLDDNSRIDAMSTSGVNLGDNTSLGRNSRIECTGSLRNLGHGIRVGKNVGLGTDNLFGCAGGIDIGDDCIFGNFVSLHSENHVIDSLEIPIHSQGVTHSGITVGRDCWIGSKVTILDGVVLGDGCVVAAGSVLTGGNYPSFGIYGGVPAKLLKSRHGGTDG